MQVIADVEQKVAPSFVRASIANGFAVLEFSEGLTAIFQASTIYELLPYADFVYNAPLTADTLPDSHSIERF